MLALLFLVSVCFNGVLILGLLGKVRNGLGYFYILGSILSLTPLFILTSYITHDLAVSLLCYMVVLSFIYGYQIATRQRWPIHLSSREVTVYLAMAMFGWYIFAHSFSYDTTSNSLLVSSNTYMDFGAHIPFIRSFSLGNNYPATIPFFSQSGGSYYFLTHFYAGLLEYLGLRIDLALNLISALAFASIGTSVYMFAYTIKRSWVFACVGVIIFFSDQTLLWFQFVTEHVNPASWFSALYHTNRYSDSFEVFWNLNTYLNQRQLLFGIAAFLWFIPEHLKYSLYTPKSRRIFDGIVLGFLCYWHVHVFLAACLLVVLSRRLSVPTLLLAIGVSAPKVLEILMHSQSGILFAPGFIVVPLTVLSWFTFWFRNTGLLIPISVLGILYSGKKFRWLALYSLLLFTLPNVFHISVRNVFDDHKFFILWKLCMTFCVLFVLKYVWRTMLAYVLIFFLCISGIINFFVLKNDVFARIVDYAHHPLLKAVSEHMKPGDIVLTNGEIYDPINIAGIKTYTGRTQYIYTYGGSPDPALVVQKAVLSGTAGIQETSIAYIVCYSDSAIPNIRPCDSNALTKQYPLVYTDTLGSVWKFR